MPCPETQLSLDSKGNLLSSFYTVRVLSCTGSTMVAQENGSAGPAAAAAQLEGLSVANGGGQMVAVSAARTVLPSPDLSGVRGVDTQTHAIGIIHPPPDIRAIVDKTAQFVARNGAHVSFCAGLGSRVRSMVGVRTDACSLLRQACLLRRKSWQTRRRTSSSTSCGQQTRTMGTTATRRARCARHWALPWCNAEAVRER